MKDILSIIQDNFYLAFMLIVILAVFLGLGYFVVYKKLLKGSKSLSKRKVMIWFCLIGYIIMVIGVTFINRGARIYGDTNLHLFSSYREAWNSFSVATWRFIYLNIFMLVPLGILLPLLNKRFQKLPCLVGAAVLMTLMIETTQLVTGYGIFDLDDIFNNVLGAIIGYGVVMLIITILENKRGKFKRSVIYLTPLIFVIVSTFAIVGLYHAQEFGNLSIAHNYRINMRNIDLSLNIDLEADVNEVFLDNEKYRLEKVPIYRAPIYDVNSGEAFFVDFLKHKNIDSEIEVDPYTDMAIYWSRGEPSYSMWFDYHGGSYQYSDFSVFDVGIERGQTDEANLRKILANFAIVIPDEAIFSVADDGITEGTYEWLIENKVDGESITNGKLTVDYYNDDSVKQIDNQIITYQKVNDVSIKSHEEAYQELADGKFNLNWPKDVRTIKIEDVTLVYMLDTKGFYQPIYNFSSKVDGADTIISIPAIPR